MRRTIRGVMAAAGIGALAACAAAQQGPGTAGARPREFRVPIYSASNQQVGTFTATQISPEAVQLVVESSAMPEGVHGTHLHATGRCDAPEFTTAGPHLNPTNRQHGMRNPQGPHLGDLPNLVVSANGRGRIEATVRGSLTAGQAPLFDADGTALVVHATADDYVTDPSGNSGARIACGVMAAPTGG
ncbi:MAG TPA: superoxide dismutase family protein [Longimicrobium sp.]|nr:superoxide dismutase family protein [Longimicrobium sp.]